MFPEAVARYHALLANQELAEASRALLDESLEKAKLIFGGRRLSPYLRPHFVSETDFERICRICETVWSAIQKVKDAAVADPRVVDDLGLTEIERELVSIDPGYVAVSPTSRLDSFLTQSAYSFVELNGESPAGIAYADAAYDIFSSLPVMKKFGADYNLRPMYGRGFMLDVLLRSYEEFLGRKPERPPRIAIVDLAGVPTVSEFELFRDFFEQSGYPSLICTPQELEFRNNRLNVAGKEIDIVYKRLLVNEYLPIMRDYPALVDAYRAGAVCMVNSFRSKLIHKKSLFAVLTDPRYASLFTANEQEMISGHVPWTRRVRAGKTDYFGEPIDLIDFISERRDRLVLKPNDDYGGHGIFIGWHIYQIGWDGALHNALADGDYLGEGRGAPSPGGFPA